MQITIHRKDLSKAISLVNPAVSPRSTLPILGNILVEAKNGQLRLAATNREIAITCWLDGVEIRKDGAITLPAKLLAGYVNSLPPEPVTLKLDERTQSVRIECAQQKATLKGIDAFDFPLIVTIKQQSTDGAFDAIHAIPANELSSVINQVVFAAADDMARPILCGVLATIKNGAMKLAATDGYRLSIRQCGVSGSDSESIIIPAKNLAQASRLASDATGSVEIAVSPNQSSIAFAFQHGDNRRIELQSELVGGKYPPYESILPKEANCTATIATNELEAALSVARLFARDNANIVQMHYQPADGRIAISATSAELGDTNSHIAAGIVGDEVDIAFDVTFWLELLKHVTTDRIIVELTNERRPALVRMDGVSADVFQHVIMPMNPPK